jgi:hypothetical protein
LSTIEDGGGPTRTSFAGDSQLIRHIHISFLVKLARRLRNGHWVKLDAPRAPTIRTRRLGLTAGTFGGGPHAEAVRVHILPAGGATPGDGFLFVGVEFAETDGAVAFNGFPLAGFFGVGAARCGAGVDGRGAS